MDWLLERRAPKKYLPTLKNVAQLLLKTAANDRDLHRYRYRTKVRGPVAIVLG